MKLLFNMPDEEINKIKEKMKDPITKRKKYTSDDAVIDDAVFYYFDELKHSGRLQ